ncbi:DUF6318 family protein [Cellulomonas soli]
MHRGTATADPAPSAPATGEQASPSSSPSPSATAAAPQWTAAMDEVSVNGARGVAQYFLDLYPYVLTTGDTTEWDRLSHPECVYCADVRDTFGSKPAHGQLPSADWTLVRSVELDPGVYFSVEFKLVETDAANVATDFTVLVGVVRESDHWLIRAVQIDEVAAAGE